MVESSCHHAIFDDGGLALGYVLPPPPLPPPPSLTGKGSSAARPTGSTGWRKRQLRLLLVLHFGHVLNPLIEVGAPKNTHQFRT